MITRTRKKLLNSNDDDETFIIDGNDLQKHRNQSKIKDNDGHDLQQQEQPNYREDLWNILLLLLLYMLQGIPIGLIAGVPFLLVNRGVSYQDQAIFSFAIWPFSFKLLWAPIVDSVYWKRFGRRKSWMIPSQYLLGLFMLFISYNLDSMLNLQDNDDNDNGNKSGPPPNIYSLTGMFMFLNFLAATQDIAVDGWALTMLKSKNVGYASTCNTVGQTAGYFFGYIVFLILESKQFANYFRSEPKDYGLISLNGFFYFWGWIFLIVTTLVMVFKSEQDEDPQSQEDHSASEDNPQHHQQSILKTYLKLIEILKLKPVQNFVLILLTCKIGFAITDSATGLKLKEAGIPMDHLAMMAIPLIPLQIILPWIIGRYTNGPRPLDVFLWAYPYRLLFCYILAGILIWTKNLKASLGYFPLYYYLILLLCYALQQITVYSMYVSLMAFHAKISDPLIGGTYMTLLNTITNLGGNWPTTLALWLLDWFTYSYCTNNGQPCSKQQQLKQQNSTICGTIFTNSSSQDGNSSQIINDSVGECKIWLDGYYLETIICTAIGLCWYFWAKKRINFLQTISLKSWRCCNRNHNRLGGGLDDNSGDNGHGHEHQS